MIGNLYILITLSPSNQNGITSMTSYIESMYYNMLNIITMASGSRSALTKKEWRSYYDGTV